MAKTREIKGRIKAVGNIKRITKTMQMIATARFQAALKRATSAKPYTEKIAELVAKVSGSGAGGLAHPLLSGPDPAAGRHLLLVLTANRGLCGGYNANVLRRASQFLKDHAEEQVDVEVVGKKGVGYFRFTGTAISKHHSQFTDEPAYQDVAALAETYMQVFSEGRYDTISVAYMAFESVGRQTPTVRPLLPLKPPAAAEGEAGDAVSVGGAVDYEILPDPEAMLAELLPITLKTALFQCFNEVVVGEQVARMVAMKAATDAATKMGKRLQREFNRARQTAITTELSEIIAGAASLE